MGGGGGIDSQRADGPENMARERGLVRQLIPAPPGLEEGVADFLCFSRQAVK